MVRPITRRMRFARDEISHWSEFDHVVVNSELIGPWSPCVACFMLRVWQRVRLTGIKGFIDRL